MACFMLRDPEGNERWIAEHEEYVLKPGEQIIPGAIEWNCGPQPSVQVDATHQLIAELDFELGKKGLGESFKYLAGPVARMIGKHTCTSCEVRRVIANAYARLKGRHGRLGAVARMSWLISLSIFGKEEKVIRKLKAYIND